MKSSIDLLSHEVISLYEGDALVFAIDAFDVLREFDSIPADIWFLENLWKWLSVDFDLLLFSGTERKDLLNLFKRIHDDIERILNDVQPEESLTKGNESESSTALHQGGTEGLQEPPSDVLHHWV